MTKKFDVIIGNPPYQEEAEGSATHGKPIYHLFMDAAYESGRKVILITPARFLFNAGYTPKSWNTKMLSDPHLSVTQYLPDSNSLFPGTDIKGGIAVTYRDEGQQGIPIGTFTSYPELNVITQKVATTHSMSLSRTITSSRSYRYTQKMHDDHKQAESLMAKGEKFKVNTKTFRQLDFLYHAEKPNDAHPYSQVLGLVDSQRKMPWIRSEYIQGPDNFQAFKVAVPKANGSGKFGEPLASPIVLPPNTAVTQTFITIGCFNTKFEAEACLKYVKSKFSRALLGTLKITQDNPARTWEHVPIQDFTGNSDIDWLQPISNIDQQLFSKYNLSEEETLFIENNVRPMDK